MGALALLAFVACSDDDNGNDAADGGPKKATDGGSIKSDGQSTSDEDAGDEESDGSRPSDGGAPDVISDSGVPISGPIGTNTLPLDTVLTTTAQPTGQASQESSIENFAFLPALDNGKLVTAKRTYTFRARPVDATHGDGAGISVWWTIGTDPNEYLCTVRDTTGPVIYVLTSKGIADYTNPDADSKTRCAWELIKHATDPTLFAIRSHMAAAAGKSFYVTAKQSSGPNASKHVMVTELANDASTLTYYKFNAPHVSTNLPKP